MYLDYHDLLEIRDRALRPDRRPLPLANEIRLRVKRLTRTSA